MRLETNQISRDWTILYAGRRFYVNYTDSDGHTLALCNRNNWEVWEETDEEIEELDVYSCEGDTSGQRARAEANSRIQEKLIGFCIENWDNQFTREIKGKLDEHKESLGGTSDE